MKNKKQKTIQKVPQSSKTPPERLILKSKSFSFMKELFNRYLHISSPVSLHNNYKHIAISGPTYRNFCRCPTIRQSVLSTLRTVPRRLPSTVTSTQNLPSSGFPWQCTMLVRFSRIGDLL